MQQRRTLRSGTVELGLVVILLASLAVRLPFVHGTLHDDAFISMRYAHRLATGAGLTFNDGERVEGFTNFLWTVALAAVERAGIDIVAATPWLSVIPSLALLVVLFVFGVRYAGLPQRGWALVAPAVVAAQPFLIAESTGGLETTLYIFLVTVAFVQAVAARRGAAPARAAAAACAVATLVRPEGALAFAILLASGGGGGAKEPRARGLARDVGVYVLLVAPLLVFRWIYYADWVPNTYHAKVGWNLAQVARGGRYLRDYGLPLAPLPLLLLAAIGVGRGWRVAAAAVCVVAAAYAAAVGGDFAPTGRFVLVAVPFLALLVQSGSVRVAQWWRRPRVGWVAAVLLVAFGTTWSGVASWHRLTSRGWPVMYRRDLEARRYLGQWFATTLPPQATVAVGSIGAIGYYCHHRILDTFGLTNAAIGRLHVAWMGKASAGHEKGDADVVLRARPEIIVFDRAFLAPRRVTFDEFIAEARSPTEQLLVQDPRLFQEYGLRSVETPMGVLHWLERAD